MSIQLQGANALTLTMNSGALAIGSTPTGFSTGAAINYLNLGQFYSKAATATQAFVIEPNSGLSYTNRSAFVSIPSGQACTFAVLLDSAGSFTVVQGDLVDQGQLAPVAQVPGRKNIVGAIKVVNAAATAFVPGTTALNAANVTTTYFNLGVHPGRSL